MKKYKSIFISITVLILITASYFVGYEKAKYDIRSAFKKALQTSQADNVNSDKNTNKKKIIQVPSYNINQEFTDNLIKIQVIDFETRKTTRPGSTFDNPKQAKGAFVYVNVKVKNISHASLSFGGSFNNEFIGRIKDDKNNYYDPIEDQYEELTNKKWYDNLNPNEESVYSIIFDIPESITDFNKLHFKWLNSQQKGFEIAVKV